MANSKADFARHVAAWLLGMAAAVLPWVAIRYVPADVNKWASIYIAGALGGLSLEFILGRGRIELPAPTIPTTEDQEKDERRPLGPMLDLGFFARVASSGIGAMALLLVYHALVDAPETGQTFDQIAADPSTFGWAVFLGASSPAVWTASQRWVQSRIEAATAANSAQLTQATAVIELARNKVSGMADASAANDLAEADQTTVLGEIQSVVSAAADAAPGEIDISKVSLNLFGNLRSYVVPSAATSVADQAALNRVLGILESGLAGGQAEPPFG